MARKANANANARRQKKLKEEQQRKQKHRQKQKATHASEIRKLFKWLLPANRIFHELKLHGNTTWTPITLVCLALCWAWAEKKYVTDAFDYGSDWCRSLADGTVLSTYQGLMYALERHTETLMKILWQIVHQRMKEIGGEHWETEGWVVIAFDGSRDATPRTKANEAAFCAPNYGKGKTAKFRQKKTKGMRRTNNEKNRPANPRPNVWITLMWHVGMRLPWMWRLGPSNSSERGDVMAMLDEGEFPENTLFCGDAGFVGYELWSAMVCKGHHFLVRVGANVSLLTELADCSLDKGKMIVMSWPQEAIKAGRPPLRLRLVKVRVGKTWMWLLSSVLDQNKLNVKQLRNIYKQRWGIEVEFRGLKQTLDKAELRCRNEVRIRTELHWSLMAMTIAELFALKVQLGDPPAACQLELPSPTVELLSIPQKRSLAEAVRALRWSLNHLHETPSVGQSLPAKLWGARTDSYNRKGSKAARYRPPNPDKKPLGEPKIRLLTAKEKIKLNAFNTTKTTA